MIRGTTYWQGLMLALALPASAADLPASPPIDAGASAYSAAAACPLWQPRYGISYVPTNAPCDPTYVGSTMGLSRPSYYGALPALATTRLEAGALSPNPARRSCRRRAYWPALSKSTVSLLPSTSATSP